MRVGSLPLITALMLVTVPRLVYAQSSEPVGQTAAGPSESPTYLDTVSAVPAQPVDASSPAGDQASLSTDETASLTTDSLPVIDHVPVPSPGDELAPQSESDARPGPTLAAATAGVHAQLATTSQSTNRSKHQGGLGTDAILMIVGVAALVTGLLIGGGAGTAIAIAGAVIGLYGLYLYLQ
jgi:hypothetical protein